MTARGGRPIQLIHITGAADEENVRRAYQTQGRRAWVGAFHHQMQNAYAAADLAVARSGAASLTELAHFGVPSILIPYPHAAEDHQTRNAEIFVKAGAAEMMAEASAEPESLANRMELILDQDRHKAMAGAALSLSNARAAEKVADILMDAAKHRRNE
jgi:UDP-N-acetylglucosamine--N-acetylmuramyl-(pentapeptide) pyrophosphoryl-undecaprenol N-acetylglucosamine transferase